MQSLVAKNHLFFIASARHGHLKHYFRQRPPLDVLMAVRSQVPQLDQTAHGAGQILEPDMSQLDTSKNHHSCGQINRNPLILRGGNFKYRG